MMRNCLKLAAIGLFAMTFGQATFAHEIVYPPAAYRLHTSGQVYILPYPVAAAHGVAAPAPTYAYGWFGVVPRSHKCHHYGFYNNYRECAER
jgi:hypothetical protein